jgi:hypothetical protein
MFMRRPTTLQWCRYFRITHCGDIYGRRGIPLARVRADVPKEFGMITTRSIGSLRCATRITLLVAGFALAIPVAARGATIFFGPTPYLSAADIPVGFYEGGLPTGLEDFEDGLLGFGITASTGGPIGPGTLVDSVDADDGAIDGSGNGGVSWFTDTPIMFTFSGPLPTAAGMVWTDGSIPQLVSFEAFGPGMVSLGVHGPFPVGDGDNSGETAEDRFFGVQDSGGILAIRFLAEPGPLEVDHVQFGLAPAQNGVPGPPSAPEPASVLLFGTGLLAVGARRWRRHRRARVIAE